MSNTTLVLKKYYEPKPVTRDRNKRNHYWVRSEKYGQLYYRVILSDQEIYCACKFFKHKHEICKHLFKVMSLEGRTV